jgi:2-C-methyl-D-erythritol 4-phosphate cytidylyltransferase
MNIAVIIPAAGASRRYIEAAKAEQGLLSARSKLDEDLGGRPVLQRTVELFTQIPEVSIIIVAGPHDPESFASFKQQYADKLGLLGCKLCVGGAVHRYETVQAALKLVPESCTHVAVHDAARPCASPELIARVLEAAAKHPAVIPGLDVPDTLKRVSDKPIEESEVDPLDAILGAAPRKGSQRRAVEATVDRARLVAVQTPQVFERELLLRAYAQKDLTSTDDAQLIERLGERVVVVEGEPRNIKLTKPGDLILARAILNAKPPAGRDAHMRF